jgi:hypothetical protein
MSTTNPTKATALLWVHTEAETGLPVSIDIAEWYGPMFVLEYIKDEKNFNDILINVPREDWVRAVIESTTEESRLYVMISPEVQPPKPEPVLNGRLILAGNIFLADDEECSGILIEIPRDQLKAAKIPLYRRVSVVMEGGAE